MLVVAYNYLISHNKETSHKHSPAVQKEQFGYESMG